MESKICSFPRYYFGLNTVAFSVNGICTSCGKAVERHDNPVCNAYQHEFKNSNVPSLGGKCSYCRHVIEVHQKLPDAPQHYAPKPCKEFLRSQTINECGQCKFSDDEHDEGPSFQKVIVHMPPVLLNGRYVTVSPTVVTARYISDVMSFVKKKLKSRNDENTQFKLLSQDQELQPDWSVRAFKQMNVVKIENSKDTNCTIM